jgi:hypothetical protein
LRLRRIEADSLDAMGRSAWLAGALVALAACDETSSIDGTTTTTSTGGGGGQPERCPPGEEPLDDSGCREAGALAGIPPEACADGFTPSDHGCVAVLPATPCTDGTMAVPGETSCHELTDCGNAQWGAAPVDITTVYVDQAYLGGMSDGSVVYPFTTIQEAIDAANPGAIVVVAAGVYPESVTFAGKPIRLWGRCPRLVEVTAVTIAAGAGGSELHTLAFAHGAIGVHVLGAVNVQVDRVWVHDTDATGILLEGVAAPASAHVSGSLVEHASGSGIFAASGSAIVESTAVRDTLPETTTGKFGRAIDTYTVPGSSNRASMQVSGSLLERSRATAVFVGNGDLILEGTLVRDTDEQASDMKLGFGLYAQPDTGSGSRSSVTVTGSVFERHQSYGMLMFATDADITATAIREGQPEAVGQGYGYGIGVRNAADGAASDVTIVDSLLEENHGGGIYVDGSKLLVERTLIRDTLPQLSDQKLGRAIIAQAAADADGATEVTVRGSAIERSYEVGIFATASQLLCESTRVRDTVPSAATDRGGRGIVVQLDVTSGARGAGTVRTSLVENSFEAGVFAGASDLEVEGTLVRGTEPSAVDGLTGRGITFEVYQPTGARSSGSVRHSAMEQNHEEGLCIIGSEVDIDNVVVSDTAPVAPGLGDGISVAAFAAPASATIHGSRVEANARAGIAAFGASIVLGDTVLECNPVHLDGEDLAGPFSFQDVGGNVCGCGGTAEACKVLSTELAPPQPLDD